MSGVSNQETTSGRVGKAPIRARLITYAKNSGDTAEIGPTLWCCGFPAKILARPAPDASTRASLR